MSNSPSWLNSLPEAESPLDRLDHLNWPLVRLRAERGPLARLKRQLLQCREEEGFQDRRAEAEQFRWACDQVERFAKATSTKGMAYEDWIEVERQIRKDKSRMEDAVEKCKNWVDARVYVFRNTAYDTILNLADNLREEVAISKES